MRLSPANIKWEGLERDDLKGTPRIWKGDKFSKLKNTEPPPMWTEKVFPIECNPF